MITKTELRMTLKKADFPESSIERILGARIKTLLNIGNINKVDRIIKKLRKYNISFISIEHCSSILAIGKTDKIEKIFKALNKYDISINSIENRLTVLIYSNSKQIREMIRFLKKRNISKNAIESNFGEIMRRGFPNIRKIFLKNSKENILLYVKLKEIYNRVVTKDEIEEICKYKNITKKELIRSVYKNINKVEDIMLLTLEEKEYLYLGKSKCMEKSQLDEYGNIINIVSEKLSKNFSYRYNIEDKSEVKSVAVNIIIERCGDVAHNLNINREVMEKAIYNKCKKYLIGWNYKKKKEISIDFNDKLNVNRNVSNDLWTFNDKNNIQDWHLKEIQKKILYRISNIIEEDGYIRYDSKEYLNKAAKSLNMNIEEIIYEVREIENKLREINVIK